MQLRVPVTAGHAGSQRAEVNGRAGVRTLSLEFTLPNRCLPAGVGPAVVRDLLFTGPLQRVLDYAGPWPIQSRALRPTATVYRLRVDLPVQRPDNGDMDRGNAIGAVTGQHPSRIDPDMLCEGMRDLYPQAFVTGLDGRTNKGPLALRMKVDAKADTIELKRSNGETLTVPLGGVLRALLDPNVRREVVVADTEQPRGRTKRRQVKGG